MREDTSRGLCYNYLWRHFKSNFNAYITTFKKYKSQKKVINICLKFFQLMKREGQVYQMNSNN